jgi:hypothetical protein
MKNLIKFSLLFLAIGFMTSCQHDTDVPDGPSLITQYGPFTLLEDLAKSQDQVDFANGESVFFTARFNKSVNWELTITGRTSGAVKVIEGLSSDLDAATASWNGSATEPPLFRAEMCDVQLLVPTEDSLLLTTEVEVLSGRNYDDAVTMVDFETDLGSSLFFGNFEFELTAETGVRDDMIAGQGEKFYFFEGTDGVVDNFFCGLIRIDPAFQGNTYFALPSPDPSEVYFNTLIWHDKTPHTIAVIQFFIDTNNDGVFTDGVDQSKQLAGDFPLDHEGWKLFSHTMAETGMTEAEMAKIVTIQVLLISNKNAQPTPPNPVRYGIDFMTLTSGQPLEL